MSGQRRAVQYYEGGGKPVQTIIKKGDKNVFLRARTVIGNKIVVQAKGSSKRYEAKIYPKQKSDYRVEGSGKLQEHQVETYLVRPWELKKFSKEHGGLLEKVIKKAKLNSKSNERAEDIVHIGATKPVPSKFDRMFTMCQTLPLLW